jgi:hypothetical protein
MGLLQNESIENTDYKSCCKKLAKLFFPENSDLNYCLKKNAQSIAQIKIIIFFVKKRLVDYDFIDIILLH